MIFLILQLCGHLFVFLIGPVFTVRMLGFGDIVIIGVLDDIIVVAVITATPICTTTSSSGLLPKARRCVEYFMPIIPCDFYSSPMVCGGLCGHPSPFQRRNK